MGRIPRRGPTNRFRSKSKYTSNRSSYSCGAEVRLATRVVIRCCPSTIHRPSASSPPSTFTGPNRLTEGFMGCCHRSVPMGNPLYRLSNNLRTSFMSHTKDLWNVGTRNFPDMAKFTIFGISHVTVLDAERSRGLSFLGNLLISLRSSEWLSFV